MEIPAFLAGRGEKHCLVSLGCCAYHSIQAGASIWLHQSKGDILQSFSTQSPWLVMAAQKQRDQEQGMSQRGNTVQMPKEEAGGTALRRRPGRSWRGIQGHDSINRDSLLCPPRLPGWHQDGVVTHVADSSCMASGFWLIQTEGQLIASVGCPLWFESRGNRPSPGMSTVRKCHCHFVANAIDTAVEH